MKIFLDTANVEAIRRANDTGLLDGITTNPSKIAETGRKFTDVIKEICSIVKGPVSAEAVAHKCEDIVREALKLSEISANVVNKVPMTVEGLKAARILEERGVKTNITMIFSPDQACLAMKTNAAFVSLVLSRIDNIGGSSRELVEATMKIKRNYNFQSGVLAASLKTRNHILDCMSAGADIISIPEGLFFQMYGHPLTDQGLAEFDAIWEKTVQ